MKYKHLTIAKTSENIDIEVNRICTDGWNNYFVTDDTSNLTYHFKKD